MISHSLSRQLGGLSGMSCESASVAPSSDRSHRRKVVFNRSIGSTLLCTSVFVGSTLLAIGLLSTEIVWKIWNILIARRKYPNVIEEKSTTKNSSISEVLMFSEASQLCRYHANTRIPCDKKDCPVKNLRQIQSYLNAASSSLDLCMYIMTCEDLAKSIIAAQRRNVCVRIIVDSGMSENPACDDQLLKMRRAGIKIVTNGLKTSSLMHHKFAIIDKKVVLLGSTNWTMQAFYGNYDSIMITNYKDFVNRYSEEFEKMWLHFQT